MEQAIVYIGIDVAKAHLDVSGAVQCRRFSNDARVLAAFGAALRPKPTRPLSREQKRLRELESQRRHLSQVLRAEENRLAQLRCAELRSLGRSLINKIQKQIRAIEECITV